MTAITILRQVEQKIATLDVSEQWEEKGVVGWYINRILVPSEYRMDGIGTDMMMELCTKADWNNKTIFVHPTTNYNSDLKRLINFFKRFGFTGYAEGLMLRVPQDPIQNHRKYNGKAT